jgi:hypothetical protein
MTPEQTPPPARRPRPGADARRRALGLEDGGAPADVPAGSPAAGAPPSAAAPARRESLRDSLARIPDLTPDDDLLLVPPRTGAPASDAVLDQAAPAARSPKGPAAKAPKVPAPAAKPAPAPSTGGPSVTAKQAPAAPSPDAPSGDPATGAAAAALVGAGTGAAVGAAARADGARDEPASQQVAFEAPTSPPARVERPAPDPLAATAAAPGGPGPTDAPVIAAAARAKPPMWRRITFAVVLLGLVAAIPVLGYQGYQLISESQDGQFSGTTLSPTDPGYEAPVDPTPTAVAIQYDDERVPTGLTFLSLAGGEGGGSVIFVPLDTEVSEPSFGVDRLRTSYEVVADRPELARERLASQVGRLLNVGVDEIIDLDNAGWEQLVAPVGPLTINNPDQIDLGFGQVIPSGEATLPANLVGPYLAATVEGESDLNRLARHEAVWSAWLTQLEASGKAEAVPGESTAGISKFAKALASGPVTFDTLPVESVPGLIPLFRTDKAAVDDLITETVASPTAAVPGSRFTVRLLNGVSPDGIPSDIVRQIVGRGGAVTVLGNGPQFDTDETTIVYNNPKNEDLAKLVAASVGATGTVRLDREAPDTVDLTIVLGKDVLGDATGSGSPGATTPETTASGGD